MLLRGHFTKDQQINRLQQVLNFKNINLLISVVKVSVVSVLINTTDFIFIFTFTTHIFIRNVKLIKNIMLIVELKLRQKKNCVNSK